MGLRRKIGTLTCLYYYLPDHLGGQHALVEAATNTVASRQLYWPFGDRRQTTGDSPTGRLFTGQTLDDSTQLYYYGARYYSPVVGRFLQPDTIISDPTNPQMLNRYAYVNNNPLRYVDPTGHDGEPFWQTARDWVKRQYQVAGALMTQWKRQFLQQACGNTVSVGCGSLGSGPGTVSDATKRFTRGLAINESGEINQEAINRFEEGLEIGERLSALTRGADSDEEATEGSTGQTPVDRGKDFEARMGSQQTRTTVVYNGKTRTIILDSAPTNGAIVDFKNYNWDNPAYEKPFIRRVVTSSFEAQIKKYQATGNRVHYVFSQQPPSWVAETITGAEATYSIEP